MYCPRDWMRQNLARTIPSAFAPARRAPPHHEAGNLVIWQLLEKLIRVFCVAEYRAAFLRTRVAAAVEHDQILAGLKLNTVVDIGANRGQFALCARRLYPQAQIHSFEPLTKPARAWLENFGHDPRAHLYAKAVATRSGHAEMHVTQWDVSSSLLPIGPEQRRSFPLCAEARQETIETARLADCLQRTAITPPALLKLDVQGFELEALHGCEDLLPVFDFVYVEASFTELYLGQALASDVIALLLGHGFKLSCVANLERGRSRRPIQADFLFSRPKAA